MNNQKWLNLILILIMSAYILFEQSTNADTISFETQIERHHRMLAGNSEYFNPWQYRVFSTWILELVIRAYHFILPNGIEIAPYLFLRFLQHIAIFYLCIFYFQSLGIKNPIQIMSGLLILCFTMGNTTFHSDLSFNTYFDVIFYLTSAILILRGKQIWILPLMLLASLNRETCALIPLMTLAPFSLKKTSTAKFAIVFAGYGIFATVFFLTRYYYGFQPAVSVHGIITPWEFLNYNFSFFRLYPLLFGTFGIMPLIVVLNLKTLPPILRTWFWLIVPVWFAVHLLKSIAVETRLFLVPHVLIFLPAFLLIIENWYLHHFTELVKKE